MDSTQRDIAYWRQRIVVEEAAAKRATDPRVGRVHEIMAMRYRSWVDRALPEEPRAA